jgi:hypothetical protein
VFLSHPSFPLCFLVWQVASRETISQKFHKNFLSPQVATCQAVSAWTSLYNGWPCFLEISGCQYSSKSSKLPGIDSLRMSSTSLSAVPPTGYLGVCLFFFERRSLLVGSLAALLCHGFNFFWASLHVWRWFLLMGLLCSYGVFFRSCNWYHIPATYKIVPRQPFLQITF